MTTKPKHNVTDVISAYKAFIEYLLSGHKPLFGPKTTARGMHYYNNFVTDRYDPEPPAPVQMD